MKFDFYNYKALVTRIIDGDTVAATIQFGLELQSNKQILRLKGINAPELKGETKNQAIASREYLSSLILNKEVAITTYKPRPKDKYGRYLAEIFLLDTGQSVNKMLIEGGYAEEYEPS